MMTMTYFRVLRRFWLMNIARETQYRANFFTVAILGIFEALLTIFPMLMIYSYTDSLRGWSAGESIALTGLFRLAVALYMMTAGDGLAMLSNEVEEGKLDLLLIRPVSAQFLVSFRYVSLPQVTNVTIGALIFGIGLSRTGMEPNAIGWLQAGLIFACGLVLVTCAISAGSYLAFRLTTIEGLPFMLNDVMQMGKYPISFYPIAVRVFLTGIMPVAFISTLPMDAIRNGLGWHIVAAAIAFAAVAVIALRWWWGNNVKHYASASS